MSYFMLTFGEEIDMADFEPVKLVQLSPTARNYNYLNPIAKAICADANTSVFLVDDGETETSTLLIDEAEDMFDEAGSLNNSTLYKVIEQLAASGNAILIWWANNDLLAYQSAQQCASLDILFELATEQLRSNLSIQVFLPPNSSFKRDALKRAP